MSNVKPISEIHDLVYSEDDGWYFHEIKQNGDERFSQSFDSEESAMNTWKNGVIEFYKIH